jgi:hypothetical protein
MKSIKITLFVTAVIFISMILGSLQVHAQVSAEECAKGSKQLYIDIQNFKTAEKFGQVEIGDRLMKDLKSMRADHLTVNEKVHSLEAGFARCNFNPKDEEEIAMDTEMFLKGITPKNIED